ncbi:MAG: hypothetical protein K2L12_02950 [Clostridia bacterium]|nr:hypothetical protein [Clostridia bacterium]
MIYIIKNKFITLSVNSDGGSMTSINYLGEERLWQGDEFWQSQDVVIFPIVGHAGEYTVDGKTYEPKSHGVARYAEFALADIGVDNLTLELTSNPVTRKTYPFDFVLKITYKLKKNKIEITYTVQSKEGKIPFYVGGHPGMKAPGGEAVIEFENEESPLCYPVGGGEPVKMETLKRFVANKEFFRECKTLQLGGLSGGAITAHTTDGYSYTYKSDCPVFAFWSNEEGGEYICVEPWWGINDSEDSPSELSEKPFINFADEEGSKFTYTLEINK